MPKINKHAVYNKYARGEITLKEAMDILYPPPTTKDKLKTICWEVLKLVALGVLLGFLSLRF